MTTRRETATLTRKRWRYTGCYLRAVTDVRVPAGWPDGLAPPGSDDFEAAAVTWMLDELVPYLRAHPIRRYPVALAAIARHVTAGAADGARAGYRAARTELGTALPPHAVDTALAAYRDEGRRLAAAAKAAELVERALRGEVL
jgi:hypothetical protein